MNQDQHDLGVWGYKLLDQPGESCMGLVISESLLYTCHDALRPEVLTIPAL